MIHALGISVGFFANFVVSEMRFLACEEEYKGREEEKKNKHQLTVHQSIPESELLLFENFLVRSFFLGEKTIRNQILFILD